MEFEVNANNVILKQIDQIESGEYNITECNFTFSNEYEGLTKKAVFTGEDGVAYLETIINNKCPIPSEILAINQVVQIGVYAYAVDGEELLLRYSPEPTQFYIHQGSYKEAQNSTPPTPTEIEQLQEQITQNANDIDTLEQTTSEHTTDITDIKAEQITQNDNIQTNTNNIQTINEEIVTINQDIDNLEQTKANKTEIPTKTSDLINDSDFVSDANYVHTDNNFNDTYKNQITQNTSDISNLQSNKADKSEIPTKISQLTNDSGYITKNVDDLANYYKKSETYDKNEIDTKISSVYRYKGSVATYEDLPSTDLTIGDVYNVEEDGSNYAWTGTTWDKLGGDIDLSEYYTKTQTDSLLSAKANSSDVYNKTETYNKTEVNTLLDDKVDKVQGKGLSTNDFTDSYKNQIEANQTAITNIKDGTTIDSFGDVETALNDKEDVSNKVTELTDQSTDTQYPSAKCVYDSQEEQDTEIEALQAENAELKQDITNMAKAMYKVDGQGTDITLQNTSENKFVEFGLNGRTEQEQLTGKNLINIPDGTLTRRGITTSRENGVLTISGTYNTGTEDLYFVTNTEISIPAGTYIVSIDESISNFGLIIAFRGNSWTNVTIIPNAKSVTVTFEEDKDTLAIYPYNVPAGSSLNLTIKPMVRLSSVTDGTWEPYCGGIPSPNLIYKIPIKNVTGQANIKIQNKNLFDKNGEILNAYIFHTIIANSDNRVIIIPIKPNTQYNLSGTQISSSQDDWYMLLCEEKPIIGSTGREINISTAPYFSVNFTSGNNENWIALKFANIKKTEVEETLKTIQLEEGTTATSYVEHQEQNYPFTFAEGQRAMQGGELQDGGIYNSRKQIVFDGTEGWFMWVRPNNYGYRLGSLPRAKKLTNQKCSHLINNFDNAYNGVAGYFAVDTSGYINLCVETYDSVISWKAYLAEQYANGTPVIVEYDLAESELENNIIPYNETQQAQYNDIEANATSYDDITYISSTSDEEGFDIYVEAIGDANKVLESELQEIKSAVIALGGDLNV